MMSRVGLDGRLHNEITLPAVVRPRSPSRSSNVPCSVTRNVGPVGVAVSRYMKSGRIRSIHDHQTLYPDGMRIDRERRDGAARTRDGTALIHGPI